MTTGASGHPHLTKTSTWGFVEHSGQHNPHSIIVVVVVEYVSCTWIIEWTSDLMSGTPFLCFPLTCVYSYVPHKLAGLFESLSTVVATVLEPAAVNVFLVVSGTRAERPAQDVNTEKGRSNE